MLDYPTLRIIWWLLIGLLLIGFAIMDGHDLGVGTLLPWVGRDDDERRVLLNTVGPHWDGNQVWFITGGGAMFAAWPFIYATAFSGFYWAMLAVLWTLFLRPVGFDYRSKLPYAGWRRAWDGALFLSGFVPPLIFGVAFGNLLLGVPFTFDDTLRASYTGSFWALLNPFALLCGLVASAMITFQGATFLIIKTEGAPRQRARRAAELTGLAAALLFVAAGVWASQLPGYRILAGALPSAESNPLAKVVAIQPGAWMANYHQWPWLWLVPTIGVLAALAGSRLARAGRGGLAFIASSFTQAGIIGTAGISMFPFLLPSSLNPNASLTVWDATSSHLTLSVMFWVAVIFTPLIVLYTSWCYRVMRGPVTVESVRKNSKTAY
ncbi:cytochrome d ubiquinol oxidase subunit II [Paludibacterium purpuratum]|uniref:Cytochrome bd-I ubiquinol oxidase subunit 2 apoprotein n=1 Tax=Paludibacterium purpuratum TaxID=1144873 RepID=A0A4R7BBM4_9NEIS|nr:cytochrome d ubiquinol oxidase subunit II [Paludibacterium purpuratum]TDR81482.1 cytochrome bd-I ubiquinol oxidase subunit 2 apoprotein [Paludibacterium purpuratum]